MKKKEWELTEEEFERLLEWLEADRDQAAARYEEIRHRLTNYFIYHCLGCPDPEALSDETINRVIRKLPTFADTYTGEKTKLFYGYANFVRLEYLRKWQADENSKLEFITLIQFQQQQNQSEIDTEQERLKQCLTHCLQQLPTDKQSLLISYYLVEKNSKITHHQKMADKLKLTIGALRKQIHDLKHKLIECIENCLKK